jgi:hypothetical protein
MNINNIGQNMASYPSGPAIAPGTPVDSTGSADPAQTGISPSTVVTLSRESQPEGDEGEVGNSADRPSGAKSFAYGALGLGEPQSDAEAQTVPPEKQEAHTYYSAGRLATVGASVGAIIATLI